MTMEPSEGPTSFKIPDSRQTMSGGLSDGVLPSVFSVVTPDYGAPPTIHNPHGPASTIDNQSPSLSQTYSPFASAPLHQLHYSQYMPYNTIPYTSSGYATGSPQYGLPERIFSPLSPLALVEDRFRATLGSLTNIVRVFGSIAHMLDSTLYAGWSAVMAVVAVGEQLRHLRREHIAKWLELVRTVLRWIFSLIRGRNQPPIPQPVKGSVEVVKPTHSCSSPSLGKSHVGGMPALGLLAVPVFAFTAYYCLQKLLRPSAMRYPVAKALYPFQTGDAGCLSLIPGDDLYIVQDGPLGDTGEGGWTLVQNIKTSQTGYVPSAYIGAVESRQ